MSVAELKLALAALEGGEVKLHDGAGSCKKNTHGCRPRAASERSFVISGPLVLRQTGVQSHEPPRSTYYYALPGPHADGTANHAIIEDVQDELPCYGYRRVTHELRRRGFASITRG